MRKSPDSGLNFSFRLLAFVLLFSLSFVAVSNALFPFSFNIAKVSALYKEQVLSKGIDVQNPSLVVLGDSTGLTSLRAAEIPGAISLAVSGGSPVEAFFTLSRYLKTHEKPRCALLILSYNWRHYLEEGFWRSMVGSGYLTTEEALEVLSNDAATSNGPKLSRLPRAFWPLMIQLSQWQILDTQINDPANGLNGWIKGNLNGEILESMVRDRGSWSSWKDRKDPIGLVGRNQAYLFEPLKPYGLYDEYLKKLYDLLSKNDIALHFFHGAMAESLNTPQIQNSGRELERHLASLWEGGKGKATFHSTRVFLPDSVFYNATHPTRAGRIWYTKKIHQELPECLPAQPVK